MNTQPKKKFGQNFLTDKNLLKKIVNAAQIKEKNVLEIGPGRGALTQYLVLDAKKYLAYEIDTTLKGQLNQYFQNEQTHLIFKDFMEADIQEDLHTVFGDEDIHLVGNLPYYITTPIIFKFLEEKQIKSATIMVQKEVADRLISSKNEKSYNALSAILQYFTKVTKVMDVNKKMFYPVPKVDSAVIRLEKRPSRTNDETFYIEFVKAAFLHKRKQMVNNLAEVFDVDKNRIQAWILSQGYPVTVRAEEISIEGFISLSESWRF